jgi:prepilin-type processing-associated H-X9-DG protein
MRRISFALVLLILSTTAFAQPLADRIPADAVVYVGWKGSADLGPQYDGSHTKAVIQASNLPQLFNQFLPDLIRKVRVKDPAAAEKLDLLSAVGAPLWRHPSAFYFGGIAMGENNERPVPRFALLCDAGDEAPPLVARLKTLIDQAKDIPFPLNATAQGSLVVVSSFDLPAKPDSALGAKKEFTDALAQVGKDPLASAYVDGEALLQVIDMLVNAGGDAEAIKNWPKIREVSGLTGLKRAAWSAGFDGADWAERAFIDAPAPRKGLLALLDNKPLPDDLLKSIPKSATLVAAGGFDLNRLLAEVRAAVKSIDPQAAQNLEKGLSAGSMMAGTNIEKDLLDPLGPHWAAYCAPSVGGNGILGFTLINRLDDPARAERAFNALELLANNMIVMQTRKQKDAPHIAFRQTKTADLTVHFLPVPYVAPSWAVKGQNLYVGLFPQIVTGAAAQTSAAKDSILDNDTFTRARARLGGEQASGIQFLDLPKVGADGYPQVLAIAQVGLGFADMFGVPAPAMVLPPLDKLQPHFTPLIAVARSDDRGFYYHKVMPFPGADYFGPQSQAFMGQNAMMISILLPSLNRAREAANRVKSASNLRQMGQGMFLYSNENRGKFPPDSATLKKYMADMDVKTDEMFKSPLGAGPGGEHYVYLYYEGLNNAASAEVIVAYDAAALNRRDGRDGTNLLFADGHVEWQTPPGIRDAVEVSRKVDPRSVPRDIPLPGIGAPPPPPAIDAPPERSVQPLRPRPRPTP